MAGQITRREATIAVFLVVAIGSLLLMIILPSLGAANTAAMGGSVIKSSANRVSAEALGSDSKETATAKVNIIYSSNE